MDELVFIPVWNSYPWILRRYPWFVNHLSLALTNANRRMSAI